MVIEWIYRTIVCSKNNYLFNTKLSEPHPIFLYSKKEKKKIDKKKKLKNILDKLSICFFNKKEKNLTKKKCKKVQYDKNIKNPNLLLIEKFQCILYYNKKISYNELKCHSNIIQNNLQKKDFFYYTISKNRFNISNKKVYYLAIKYILLKRRSIFLFLQLNSKKKYLCKIQEFSLLNMFYQKINFIKKIF